MISLKIWKMKILLETTRTMKEMAWLGCNWGKTSK